MLVVIFSIIALSSAAATAWSVQINHSLFQVNPSIPKAALIDPLSLTDSDPSFLWNVTHTLNLAGYSVDYFPPSRVTVALFRDLPFQGYRIVIIRSHTAIFYGIPTSISIVTSEVYDKSRYVYEQLVGQVAPAVVRPGNTFFAITPSFVRDSMQGSFGGAVVVEMGCSSLQGSHYIANAFINKGVSNFVGWDDSVGSRYTDGVTQNFVSSLAHGHTVSEAVGSAGGPDPTYSGRLSFFDAALAGREEFGAQLLMFGEFAVLLIITLVVTWRVVRGTGRHRRVSFSRGVGF